MRRNLLLCLARQPACLPQILAKMQEKFREVHPGMLGVSPHDKGAHYNGCYYGLLLRWLSRIPAEKTMSRSVRPFILLSFVIPFAALGCTDKAKPDFERCQQLEQARKFDEAREACELAHSKAPDSEAGKLASARLPVLANEQRAYDDIQGRAYQSPTQGSLPELHVETSKVDHVEITPPGQPRVVLERKDGAWRLTTPQDAPVDQGNVGSLIENLSQLQVTDVIDPAPDADAIEKFKVADSMATHVIATGGGTSLFEGWFGESTGRGQMLRLAGDNRVLAVRGYSSYRYNRLPKNWIAQPPSGG